MLFVLAVALTVSLGGMLTVWALHTPFALSCMKTHPKNLPVYEVNSLISHCQSGGLRFLCMSRKSGGAANVAVRHQYHHL